jgi:hypothetical protein
MKFTAFPLADQALDPLEQAIADGVARALRRRAAALRLLATDGVVVLDGPTAVVIVTSEARHAFNVAADLAEIADDLEGGAI